ncbi:MAG: NAD(P)H-dependent oxidoreductase subunit E, partial [Terriglobales bacterium]
MPALSHQTRARFEELAARYPQRRSALVPMLLYAQDELGYLSPEVIAEVAELLGETELAVREVIGYYSMLRTEPAGRYQVQVCTNISCLLRGGEEILAHCRRRLGIGLRQTTPDG